MVPTADADIAKMPIGSTFTSPQSYTGKDLTGGVHEDEYMLFMLALHADKGQSHGGALSSFTNAADQRHHDIGEYCHLHK